MPNGAFAKRMVFSKLKQLLFTLAGQKLDRQAQKLGVKYDFIFVRANGQKLKEVATIFEKQRLKPAIDEVYPLAEVNLALDKVAHGHSRGKTVIRVARKDKNDGVFNDEK